MGYHWLYSDIAQSLKFICKGREQRIWEQRIWEQRIWEQRIWEQRIWEQRIWEQTIFGFVQKIIFS